MSNTAKDGAVRALVFELNKSCSSMQASLRTRVNRKAKPRKVAGKQFVDKWHKKTLAEAEAAAREENGAA